MTARHITAALLFGAMVGLAGTAEAGFKVCNKTELTQSVAIGYKGDTDWTSEGWWNIKPGDCATLITGDLKKRYYYYYAEADGREFQSQNYVFCTKNDAFTIVGDTDCEKRGFETVRFREVDTGETDINYTLSVVEDTQVTPETGGSNTDTASAVGPGGGSTQNMSEAAVEPSVEITASDLQSGLPPGRYGEPFTVKALFQGCELEDGKPYCGFHTGGGKLRAYYSGPTPEGMMFALETMEVSTPVRLEGDRIGPIGLQSAVILRKVVPDSTGDPDISLRAAMQGDWVSEQNPKIGFTIRGSELYTRYNGDFRGVRFLQIADGCPQGGGVGPALMQTRVSNGQRACFVIRKMANGVMELTEPQQGLDLRYIAKR